MSASQTLLNFRFNEPEKDELLLRQHSFLMGGADALTELLMFDQNNMRNFEANMRTKMNGSEAAGNLAEAATQVADDNDQPTF